MKHLAKNKYWNIVEDYNLDKLLYLLIDRPDIINEWNDFVWTNNKNQRHRNYDLPALIVITGDLQCLQWCQNNKLHRENDKPAVSYSDGYKEYWVNRYKTVK